MVLTVSFVLSPVTGLFCSQSSRGDLGGRKPKYFFKQDWAAQISLIRFNKFAVARKRRRAG
jgi:hypothetical protein